jgi:hypothetical protein
MYNADTIYAANSVRDYALDTGVSMDNFWHVSGTNYTHTDYDYTRTTFGKWIGEKDYAWGFLNNQNRSYYAEGIVQDALDLLDYYGNTYNTNDQPIIDANDTKLDNMGILWIGEIYKDISPDIRFGGKSKEALYNNTWYIAGPAYTKNKRQVRLTWSYGDTYISRFDSLKTYSGGTENKNNVTEILSFYCESHVNPDSRYDNNRNKNDNTPMTP